MVETGLLAHLPKVPDRMPPGKGVMALGSSPEIAMGEAVGGWSPFGAKSSSGRKKNGRLPRSPCRGYP